ncbi:hypothetical protein, partial [Alloprevotella tannerae]|uniref:hypothetical protein n=1 Tax=Alloprevotella tannerae TaxID=76122 RepID=UPI0028E442D1
SAKKQAAFRISSFIISIFIFCLESAQSYAICSENAKQRAHTLTPVAQGIKLKNTHFWRCDKFPNGEK